MGNRRTISMDGSHVHPEEDAAGQPLEQHLAELLERTECVHGHHAGEGEGNDG